MEKESEHSSESYNKEKSLQNSLQSTSDKENYERDFSQISEDAATPNAASAVASVDFPKTQSQHSTVELPSVQSSTHLSARSSKFESFASGIVVVNESQSTKSSSNNKSSTDETKSSRATVINKRSKRASISPESESSKEDDNKSYQSGSSNKSGNNTETSSFHDSDTSSIVEGQESQHSSVSAKSNKSVAKSNKKRYNKVAEESLNFENSNCLHYFLMNNNCISISDLPDVANQWINFYKTNKDQALLVLLQLFVSSSDCKGKITDEMIENLDHVIMIEAMMNEFPEGMSSYLFAESTQKSKKFKENFSNYLNILIHEFQNNNILYDSYIMDHIISFLIGMTRSKARPFRHVATLGSMKLMVALTEVLYNRHLLNNKYTQFKEKNIEILKNDPNKFKNIEDSVKSINSNISELNLMLRHMFKEVFTERYIDVVSNIRSICICEISNCMLILPGTFLTGDYLKYVGILMYDKSAEVRLSCLEVLIKIYEFIKDGLNENKFYLNLMQAFMTKYNDRILAMAWDINKDVSTLAVKVFTFVLNLHQCLNESVSDKILQNIFNEYRPLAQAAGEFLCEHITKMIENTSEFSDKAFIGNLIDFLIDAQLPDREIYLVDAIIDYNESIKNWESIIELLLGDILHPQEAYVLTNILMYCIKQLTTGESPRKPSKKSSQTTKEIKFYNHCKIELTKSFAFNFTNILKKYVGHVEILVNLLTITQYFYLDVFEELKAQKNLKSLFNFINAIVIRTNNIKLLNIAALTLRKMCNDNTKIYLTCYDSCQNILKNISDFFQDAFKNFQALNDKDTNETYEKNVQQLTEACKKIYLFITQHNMNSLILNLWVNMQFLFENFGNKYISEELILYCMDISFFYILWDYNDLCECQSDRDKKNLASSLINKCNDIQKYLIRFINYNDGEKRFDSNVSKKAYLILCDLYMQFRENLSSLGNLFEQLILKPNEYLQNLLYECMLSNVFNDTDENSVHSQSEIDNLIYNKKKTLAAFVELIIKNALDQKYVMLIFKNCTEYFKEYEDIIKKLFNYIYHKNAIDCSYIINESLASSYNDLCNSQNDNSLDLSKLKIIIEYAKKLSKLFPFDCDSNNIVKIHTSGINYAVGCSLNIYYLEVLSQFLSKLAIKDKKNLSKYLDNQLDDKKLASSKSYINYKKLLAK